MKHELSDYIIAELEIQGVPYEKNTADNGMVTLTFDAESVTKGSKIVRKMFEQGHVNANGSVLLKQKKVLH
jgi:hypothetical protein